MARGHNQGEGNSANPFANLQNIEVELNCGLKDENKQNLPPVFIYKLVENNQRVPIKNVPIGWQKEISGYLKSSYNQYEERKDKAGKTVVFRNLVFNFVDLNDDQLNEDCSANGRKGVNYKIVGQLNTITQHLVKHLRSLDEKDSSPITFSIYSPEVKEGEMQNHYVVVKQGDKKLEKAIGYPTKLDGTVNPHILDTEENRRFCKEVLDFKIDKDLPNDEKEELSKQKKKIATTFFFGKNGLVRGEDGKVTLDKNGRSKGMPITEGFCADLATFINGKYNENLLKNVFGVKLVDKPDGTGKTYVKITDETADTTADDENLAPIDAEDMAEPVGEDGLPF